MMKHELEEAIRSVISTNLSLQNSLGTYASLSAKSIQLLEGDKFREARIARIEENIETIIDALNEIAIMISKKKVIKKRRRRK